MELIVTHTPESAKRAAATRAQRLAELRYTCAQCGGEFTPRVWHQKLCSRACSKAAQRAEDYALRARKQSAGHVEKRIAATMATLARTVRQCARCGEDFTPTSAPQRYCSGQCSDAVRRQKRPRHYKRSALISPAAYKALLVAQGGVCAICGSGNGKHKLAADHDHETGEVRGLLCHPCNTALGLMKDDPDRLYAARIYLLRQAVRAVEAG